MPRKNSTKYKSKAGTYGYQDPMGTMGPMGSSPNSGIEQQPPQYEVEKSKETNKDKTIFEKIKLTFMMFATNIAIFAKRQSQLKSITEYIDFNPMQKVTNTDNGYPVEVDVPLGVLKNGTMKYYILFAVLYMVFTLLPLIISVISIIYIIISLNLNYWLKSQRFNSDDLRYVDADNIKCIELFNVKFFYINDYILYVSIICIIYIFCLIYLTFSVFVKKELQQYKENLLRVLFLLSCVAAIIVIHIAIYHGNIQKIGKYKDDLVNTTYNYINYKYIDYLSDVVIEDKKCEAACNITINETKIKVCSCDKPICYVNSIHTLTDYITLQLEQLKIKASGSDIKLISIERFKSFKNDDEESYYDLIRNAILTYAFISNFVTTDFCKLSNVTVDRNFFKNRTSLIGSINIKNSTLYELNPLKCVNRNIDDMNNKSEYMVNICQECNEVMRMSNNIILNIKNEMGNFSLPLQMFTIIAVMIICSIYYLSFTINIVKKRFPPYMPYGMGMGMGMGMSPYGMGYY